VTTVSDLNENHAALARMTDALFCSDLETGDSPSDRQLAAAIRGALKTYRSWNGCTRAVAAAFGTAPGAAARRGAWCYRLAENALNRADILLSPDDLT
jgi:hypothetical protein